MEAVQNGTTVFVSEQRMNNIWGILQSLTQR